MRYSKYAREEDRDDYEADRKCAECERYLMRRGSSYCPTCRPDKDLENIAWLRHLKGPRVSSTGKPERWDEAEPVWHPR